MRAALIAARDKARLSGGNPRQRIGRRRSPRHIRRVGHGANDNEIIIHNLSTPRPIALGDKLFFRSARMHEDRINVPRHPKL